ncbi:MAG: hypothetical protein S0880_32015 [Actinomycetota bacterium]|nr:hypothetical protein [Actinomycetota bacterium]
MSTTHDHPAVRGYLARLREVAADLPRVRRDELVAEIASHIDDGLAAVPQDSSYDDRVRDLLARLGDPEDIVAAELDHTGPATAHRTPPPPPIAPAAVTRSRWGAVEILAVLALTVGVFVLPFVGPLAGIVLAWASGVWSRGAKIAATCVGVLGMSFLVLIVAPLMLFRSSSSISVEDPQPATTIEVPVTPEPLLPGD